MCGSDDSLLQRQDREQLAIVLIQAGRLSSVSAVIPIDPFQPGDILPRTQIVMLYFYLTVPNVKLAAE